MDNVSNVHGHTLRSEGAFYGASAGGASAHVASSDVAAVAVASLLDPITHNGQAYVITGPEPLTDAQVASKLATLLGKDVRYVDLPPEQLGSGTTANGIPDVLIDALLALEVVKAQGWAAGVDPAAPTVLGRPVRSFDTCLAARA